MDVDWQRLGQHGVGLLLLTGALFSFLFGMGLRLRTRIGASPSDVIDAFASQGPSKEIAVKRPGVLILLVKMVVSLAPFAWWAALENAPSSLYWKISAFVAIAVLGPSILFPYLDVEYDWESKTDKARRWFGKLIDVALKKWTVALAVAWLFALFNWHPSMWFLWWLPESFQPPTTADVIALTAILAVFLRSMFLAKALALGPVATFGWMFLSFGVVVMLYLLGITLSPEGAFFLSVVGVAWVAGLLLSLAEEWLD
jgi:hypothetical protein